MLEYTQTYTINAPIDDVWACLTDAEFMQKWGAGPAEFEPHEGGTFKMWGDYLSGKVTRIEQPFILEEEWLASEMDEPSKFSFSARLCCVVGSV